MKRNRDVSLRDVAAKAGVSLMTASNVVNRRFGSMSADTRLKVEATIDELKYRPYALARGLRLEKTFSIGVLIVDPSSSFLANPFVAQIVAGLSNVIGLRGYGCLVHGVTPQTFDESIFIRFSRTDALCVYLYGTNEQRAKFYDRLASLGEPIVSVSDVPAVESDDLAAVVQDDFNGARDLSVDVIGKGTRSIILLSSEYIWPGLRRRIDGIRTAIQESGKAVDFELLQISMQQEPHLREILNERLNARGGKTAIIAGTDRMTSLLSAARLPDRPDASLMQAGFHSLNHTYPPHENMMSLYSSAYEIGTRTADLLLARLETGRFPLKQLALPWSVVPAGEQKEIRAETARPTENRNR